MAYIHAVLSDFESLDVTSITTDLPEHASDDLLLIIVSKDDGAGTLSPPSGWNELIEAVVGSSGSNTARGAVFWKIAASSNEGPVTFTSTDADAFVWACITIKGNATGTVSDVFDSAYASNTDTSNVYTATSITTSSSDCLYLIAACCDGGVTQTFHPGMVNLVNLDSGSCGLAVGYTFFASSGATGDFNASGNSTADETVFLKVPIKDGSSGAKIPPYPARSGMTVLSLLNNIAATTTGASYPTTTSTYTPYRILKGKRDPDYVFVDDGGVFTDVTTAATNDTTGDFGFPTSEAINDAIYIGDAAPFGAFAYLASTAGAGAAIAWEYWNGSAWTALVSLTGTPTLASLDYATGWFPAKNWATTTVNSVSAYWIRARITTVFSTNPAFTRFWIGDAALFYDAIAQVADVGTNPYIGANGITPTSGCSIGGAIADFSASDDVDVSDGILVGTFLWATPRDAVDSGEITKGYGVPMIFGDKSANYTMWPVSGLFCKDNQPDVRNIYAIQPSQTQATHWHETSTAPDWSAISRQWLAVWSRYGAATLSFSQLVYVYPGITIYGGSSSEPMPWSKVIEAVNHYPAPLINNGIECVVPIILGGADGKVGIDASLFTLQWPRQADWQLGYGKFHVDDEFCGLTIDARAGDVIKLRSATISGVNPIHFKFAATASASATYDFTGLSVVNANVTLRDVTTFKALSFIGCNPITQNGATIEECTLSDCYIEADDIGQISGCAFISGGSGHAIEITDTGTYTFSGNTFDGFGSNGTTDAAIYNNSGGAVTINVAGGGDTPTYYNGSGASTTVNNSVTLTLTGLISGSDIVILDAGTTTERVNVDANSGTTYPYSFTTGGNVDICVYKKGYVPFAIRTYTLPSTDGSLPINQVADRNFSD